MTMLAWQEAKKEHERWSKKPFEALLGEYIAAGRYIYCTPEAFILAFPAVIRDGLPEQAAAQADTWFVRLGATNEGCRDVLTPLGIFMGIAPFTLPFVAWYRRGSTRIHRYPWMRAWEKACRSQDTLTGA